MGVTNRKQGGNNYPGAESLWGHQITAGAPKSINNVTSTFFNTVLFLRKTSGCDMGAPNLLLAAGAI